MAIKDLKRFGAPRKVFRGTGSIRLSDGSESRARFTFGQFDDAQLLICVDIKRSSWDFIGVSHEVESIHGKLTDGRKVNATGLFLKESTAISSTNKTRLFMYSSQWIIGEADFDGQAEVIFELVNFCFQGTESEIAVINSVKHHKLSLMTLSLGSKQVQIRQISHYDQEVAALRTQRGVRVTCTATTTLSRPSEIDNAISMIDVMCDIMSVARGTLVSWTSFDIQTVNDEKPYSLFRNSVTRRYASTALINDNDRNHSKLFLENGFQRCSVLHKDFKIRRAARAFTETRDGSFIEARSLQIAVLVEYLTNVKARLDNRTHFLNNNKFEAGWETFKAKSEFLLREIYPDSDKKCRGQMLNSMRGLMNRRPLSWKLSSLAKWLEIGFEPDEIEVFIQTRNELAHEGRFPESETPTKHYLRMQHFLDRLMLRLLGYRGPYYDLEHRAMRQL